MEGVNACKMQNIMRKNFFKALLIGIVIALCFIFSLNNPFSNNTTDELLANMSESDFEITIDNDNSIITIEHLIKDNNVSYGWIIGNEIDGKAKEIEIISLEAREIIEFEFEDYTNVYFQSNVTYENYTYSSTYYYINADGGLYESDEDMSSVSYVSSEGREISDIVSIAFVVFLLITALLYYVIGKKYQWIVLLSASVFFYLLSGIQYITFILFSSLIVFYAAKKISIKHIEAKEFLKNAANMSEKKQIKAKLQKKNKYYLSLALISSLGVMIVIKYTLFIIKNINALFNLDIPLLTLLMPLGLSFYTFMLIAYLMDVYRGKYEAEKSFARFFLFISFFPQVSQGPIARYNEVAPQLRTYHKFNYENFVFAAQRILWGFFIKLVLADRIAIFVDGVYDSYSTQSWLMIVIASLAYSVQIYADFYSSMEIAIGSAQLFGITLQENFLRPYFSRTMPEFWRRWHATLGTWFKDYVFYPISISKTVMKYSVNTRKKFGPNVARVIAAIPPIMTVWALTGLWHGSSWKFIAWGLFHGMLILLSTAFAQNIENLWNKIGIKTNSWDFALLQMIKVFCLCTIGRVFFRANSFKDALKIFWSVITLSSGDGLINLESINLISLDYLIIFLSIVALIIVGILQEKWESVRTLIAESNIWVRWAIWIILIMITVMYGKYGAGSVQVFIYDAF